jgi:hypothetical protein
MISQTDSKFLAGRSEALPSKRQRVSWDEDKIETLMIAQIGWGFEVA